MKKTSYFVRCALQAPAIVLLLVSVSPVRAELPVAQPGAAWNPYNPSVRITDQTSNYMRIAQDGNSTNNWILNWQSFNISQGNRVQFVQPSSNHIALNRIAGSNRSEILGQLDANGRIYLINPNGFLFGSTSTINVNSLVASSLALNIIDEDFVSNTVNLFNVMDNGAAFINGAGAGILEIDPGARISAETGGNVLLIAPEIINGGNITTNSGQAVLAASKDSVYLTPSNDSSLRGFLIELGGTGGHVENAGNILAERGNITLAGLAINQNGLLQATTSINENGSIRLLARDQAAPINTPSMPSDRELTIGIQNAANSQYVVGSHTGSVTLGEQSQITISPDKTDTTQVVDEQTVKPSRVEITGHDITLQSGASIVATGGDVLLHATSNAQQTAVNDDGMLRDDRAGDTSLIVMESGSSINVSGTTDTHVAMERNQLEIQLTGDFLRDAPLQRDGALHNETVSIDIREGTPLGDISDTVAANVKRDIGERLSTGGNVNLLSQGGVLLQQGSEVNITGGAVTYDSGYVSTSRLVTTLGEVVDIGNASPDLSYQGLFGEVTLKSDRWGSAGERHWSIFGSNSGVTHYYSSYTEGQNAGSFSIHAPAIDGMANVVAGTDISQFARTTTERSSGGELNIITTGQNINVVRDASAPVLADMQQWLQNGGNSLSDFSLQLDEALFNESGLGNVVITEDRSNSVETFTGNFIVNRDVQVNMLSGSTLSVDSGAVEISGDINLRGGNIRLNSSSMASIDGQINVSGTWVNDLPEVGGNLTQAVDVNAGSINIQAVNIDLTENSALLANGGGWLQSNEEIKSGKGGKILLAVRDPAGGDSTINLEGRLQAFGVNAARGGSLSIAANRIHITPEFSTNQSGLLQLTPEFFTQNGFSDYALIANKGDLKVADGAQVTPRSQSLVLNPDAIFNRSGTDVRDFSQEVELPLYQRAATNLSLTSNQNAIYSGQPQQDSSLTIEQGASIITDPGAHVSLSSASRLIMQGEIIAPGGDISLELNGYKDQDRVDATQTIWMDGKLDVSGVFVADPEDDSGLRRGRMYDGGNIVMTANNGFVITTANSSMDISAISDTIDLPSEVAGNTAIGWDRQEISGNAGRIAVSAAEGFVLAGDMNATAANNTASAGHLELTLNAQNRENFNIATYATSHGARQIDLVQSETDLPNIASGTIPVSGNNILIAHGYVAADSIIEAGFDSVRLNALNFDLNSQYPNGQINLHNDINLSLRQALVLNAPVVFGNGNVSLDAAYVFVGNQPSLKKDTSLYGEVASTGGNGELNIHAEGLLEVAGNVRLQGFDNVTLQSDGDLRLRGTDNRRNYDPFLLDGSLYAGLNLNLQADQIYGSTLSVFNIRAADTINISSGDQQDSPVLSAGSVLSFEADTINQGGVVKAPMGEIHFNAHELNILDGSLTSVSAENQMIPFGQIRGERLWYYGEDRASPVNLANSQDSAPAKRIALDADVINMAQTATFDISGGGDLYAWEHVPGLGGTNDNLLPEFNNGAFAVMPGVSSGYAPYDEIWWQGVTGINPGDQIYLEGSSKLAAGLYTILPARYALLPGAVLVTPTQNQLVSGQFYQQLDGANVVAGQRHIANTNIQDQLWTGYIIENGDVVRSRSEYFEATASQFFRDAAIRNNTTPGVMPEDAGSLDIIAGSQLTLAGNLSGDAANVNYVDENGVSQTTTGHASQVNISGDELRVVTAYDNSGGIQLLDDALNNFGAASLLLGGTRERTSESTGVTVTASNITLETNTELNVPDLIMAANNTITLNNASIHATGEAGNQDEILVVNGDGALIRASNAEQANIIRKNESANPVRGVLTVGVGSQISAGRSMILDSSLDTVLNGTLVMNHGSLNLGARRISLGEKTIAVDSLLLDATDFAQLYIDELILSSRSSVDFYGDFQRDFTNLVIEAGAINGYQQQGENVVLNADSISLGNIGNAVSNTAPSGAGNFIINAGKINLNDGNIALRGFNDIALQSESDISIAGTGSVTAVTTGDLTLVGRITASQRRADYSITTGGQLVTDHTTTIDTPRSETLAASLEINAKQITHKGVIDLASGNVTLHSTGIESSDDVVLEDGSVINVSGIARDFAGDMKYSQGGSVKLLSAHGDINQTADAEINVSGGDSQGNAGSIETTAAAGNIDLSGRLLAAHATTAQGGSFAADASSINNFSILNQQLEQNGFDQQRTVRLRQGDLNLSPDESITAHDVMLAADAGSVTVAGDINASGDKGGNVILAARDNVTVSNGATIDASATGDNEHGGKVLVETRQGAINLEAGSTIDVSGTERGGRIHLRAPRTANNAGINITSAAASITGAERIDVEGFREYSTGDNVLDLNDFTPAYNEASQYFTHSTAILASLGLTQSNVHFQPGIAFYRNGNLTINDMTLSTSELLFDDMTGLFSTGYTRHNFSLNGREESGVLTVRASGDVLFAGSLSDGVVSVTDWLTAVDYAGLLQGESWSYRVVAGADNSAAHIMTTQSGNADLYLSANQVIRTGSGDIDIAVADTLVLGDNNLDAITNTSASIYSAGVNTGRGSLAKEIDLALLNPDLAGLGYYYNLLDLMVLPGVQFPDQGGDVSIRVGGNVQGNATSYLSSDWLHRAFADNTLTTWGVDFRYFNQGVGAFGGGDLKFLAGGNVDSLALYSPVTGRQVGDYDLDIDANGVPHYVNANNQIDMLGGGDVSVNIAGNLSSSMLHVDKGDLNVFAEGNIGNSNVDSGLYLLLADTNAHISANGDVYIQGVGNATLQDMSKRQDENLSLVSAKMDWVFFNSMSTQAALNVYSLGGDVALRNTREGVARFDSRVFDNSGFNTSEIMKNYPAQLNVLAIDGGISFNSLNMLPASSGNFSLIAQGNVQGMNNNDQTTLAMWGFSPDEIQNWTTPMAGNIFGTRLLSLASEYSVNLHSSGETSAHIVANHGDIRPANEMLPLVIQVPKSIFFYAGRDIISVNLFATHTDENDISIMEAGRDFRHINTAQYGGSAKQNEIKLYGPGELQIIAGRDIELGNSTGIQTLGDIKLSQLADNGSDILIMAGANHADYQAFITEYFTANSDYAADVIGFMNARGFAFADDQFEQAMSAFKSLSEIQQREFVLQAFFNEIKQSAQRAAEEQNNKLPAGDTNRFGYTRGLDAIASLFPDSVLEHREAAPGETTLGNMIVTGGQAYVLNNQTLTGDITMVSSNISVKDDGSNLYVLAPVGMLNVGLSVRGKESNENPNGLVNFGNGDINIYAMNDIAVNQSRIQALNGGDMTIWSTLGDIDAGKGAKSVLSLPEPLLRANAVEGFYLEYLPVVQGSGIRNACFDTGCDPGDIVLAAPGGVIDAGDAGINAAGNLTLATDTVLNAGNIEAGGDSVGFSTETTALGLDVGNLGNAASDSTSTVTGEDAADAFSNAAVAILQVEVMGLSDEEGSVSGADVSGGFDKQDKN